VAFLRVWRDASSEILAALTFWRDLIAAWIEVLRVADQGWMKLREMSSSWTSRAEPTLSCATAYVFRTVARREGPTSTAPLAAARERAWGSVFWTSVGFCSNAKEVNLAIG